MFEIREDDLSGEAARGLLALHLAGMHANFPPGSVFALELLGLLLSEVTVWTVWHGDGIAGVGALKALRGGELKSIRTHLDMLRRSVAGLLLDHMNGEARTRGFGRLSLETGSGPSFDAALSLYRGRGFVEGETFSGYERSAFNRFLHLRL